MRNATKQAVTRKGSGYRIDVLAVREAIQGNTLSESDRKIVDRFMPGICQQITDQIQSANAVRPRNHSDPSGERQHKA
jgi:hypothetical protein